MNDEANPYAAPADWGGERGVAISRQLTEIRMGIMILIGIQTLTGLATAVVIQQEGLAARSFVVGMALFTMIIAALIAYAGAMRMPERSRRLHWGMTVTATAWGTYLVSLVVSARLLWTSARIPAPDMFRCTFMAGVTMAFVLVFLWSSEARGHRRRR